MGKGRPRSVEKGVLGQSSSASSSSNSLKIPPAPVYYPNEEEFKDPLEFICKIRPEAEPYGICRIVPPKDWKPPFALDLESFKFPTKTQAIHQLQVRSAACDSETFELEYNRFLEAHCGRKAKKRVVFEGEELDLCKLFNAVKRYGGYDKAVDQKKWGEVFRFVWPVGKISECAKHVLCQLYREHLYDYESYYNRLNQEGDKNYNRGMHKERKSEPRVDFFSSKRRRKNNLGERFEVEEGLDQICEQCNSGLHGEVMLLCDRCDKGWHIYCLSPPLKRIPPGNWYCLDCLNSEKDSFGFVPGKQYSVEAFKRVAERAKRKWFGSVSASRVQLEKKFWEIVEGSVGEVEVMYGSDLDTSVYGSGFPRVNDQKPPSIGAEVWDKYCATPWNLNKLPMLQGSMLRAVHNSIAGVMVPWLYIGMLFSSFCWHFEDHCFYSMNYLHWGEPKCWYSVPGSEAGAFEKVMRNSLPDLFDAQPDLLFQLVTMLNPSVLQEHDVPVYSVLQEPGNFVITFPRSYHGGFNFGLNCAEAVNFAPADWLPHGSFGAELYQLYHKAAVLSHEELLCVVAKSDFDSKVSPYLNKELRRIYDKEKTWRGRLWRNGIIRSSPMSPRKQPKYVGVEEDPTCIICQRFLHISAVVCRCRPSAFVCLEHWEHICECKPNKHCLTYRYTLAELNDLVLMTENQNSEAMKQNRNVRRQHLCTNELGSLSKKVKGGHVTFAQLAEDWLLKSCKILQTPYTSDAYRDALKAAEQFLWAGSEMDPVRDMVKNLIEAQNWAKGVKDCLSKLVLWSSHRNHEIEKVRMEHVNSLLGFNPLPCNEPGILKLKLWTERVRKCISEANVTVEVDILYKLKAEIPELQVQLPETEMLLDLIKQVDSCRSQCNEMLKGSVSLKKLEGCLGEMSGFTVNIPELELLRQYRNDAVSWFSRFNDVVKNIHEREDQESVVEELTCLKRDGALLKVQVDDLPCVEVELKKACCRVKALKLLINEVIQTSVQALRCKMSLEYIQQVIMEATILEIEKEMMFVEISRVLALAMHWEERAKRSLAREAQMSEFEDVIRTSEEIFVILPSMGDVKEAISAAKSWLNKSKPFLCSDSSVVPTSCSLLKIEDLKDLSSQSELLKISLEERSMLQRVLEDCVQWENDACSLLHDAECLLGCDDIGDGRSSGLILKIESQVAKIESVVKAGLPLAFEFVVIPKLRDAASTLRWCFKALCLCAVAPGLEEVEMLLEAAGHLPVSFASCVLLSSLRDGVNWLKRALSITVPGNLRKYELGDAEEVLGQSRMCNVSFPAMVGQLAEAIKKHNLVWKNLLVRCMGYIDQYEIGRVDAFNCSEQDIVFSEVDKVEQWKDTRVGNREDYAYAAPVILESKSYGRVLYARTEYILKIYHVYSYHLSCLGPALGDANERRSNTCACCHRITSGKIPRNVSGPLLTQVLLHLECVLMVGAYMSYYVFALQKVGGNCPELKKLIELLSGAEELCVGIEEGSILRQILEKALACKAYLAKVVNFALAYSDNDLSIVAGRLSTAYKAVEVALVYDSQGYSKFELALARHSWRLRAHKLLEGSEKPAIQQIQQHLKEGLTIGMPPEDHFWQRVTEVRRISGQWADKAKQVSLDSGTLGLEKVFELINEGENLPVHFCKELKLLRDRSMLYCICRKPYDQRAMIACDKCDEWYHFDCIKLSSTPKTYICPACKFEPDNFCTSPSMTQERQVESSGNCEEPQTPSPRQVEVRRKSGKRKSSTKRNMLEITDSEMLRRSSGIGCLLWSNRKPFRRAARKRSELEIFSPFSCVQQQ
ncbi:hypothetical protein RJ639_033801 [Escallonia herrerae]|uniref:[Histone H3]-trimethyl-L-lysine(4) demethylase n=1 Tax=Escallonia herrerae TaxID=1293975 RepID=A0AA88X240_9ASTE|nr:hypothetical protein RJ639_033801 [Escallonia herrerae]